MLLKYTRFITPCYRFLLFVCFMTCPLQAKFIDYQMIRYVRNRNKEVIIKSITWNNATKDIKNVGSCLNRIQFNFIYVTSCE